MFYPFAAQIRILMLRCLTILSVVISLLMFTDITLAETDKDFAAHMRKEGRQAQSKGNYREALFYYTRAAGFNPQDASLQNDLGLMLEQAGQFQDAVACYHKALELNNHYLPAYSNLGELYETLGQYELAAMNFQQRVYLGKPTDPWTLKAQERLESLYEKFPQLKSARISDMAKAMDQDMTSSIALTKSVTTREKAVEFELAMIKGLSAFEGGDYEGAREYFESASLIDPHSYEARHAAERCKVKLRFQGIEQSAR